MLDFNKFPFIAYAHLMVSLNLESIYLAYPFKENKPNKFIYYKKKRRILKSFP
jgi:hypothetical protein